MLRQSFVYNCSAGDYQYAIRNICLQAVDLPQIEDEPLLVRFLLSEILRTKFDVLK